MRIFITGSEGLIGSSLRKALAHLKVETVGLDLSAPPEEQGTILDPKRLLEKAENCTGIVHLAAVSRVIWGEKNPKLCWDTNVQGTKHILDLALTLPQKPWVIYASSREVYGKPSALPVTETAPLHPINIYGESKVEAESLVQNASQKGLKTAIIRFSNVYGSVHDHPDRVIPAFCLAAATGKTIRIEGKDTLFDFTYLEDVIQGLLFLINRLTKEAFSLSPIHFTSGKGTSLEEIATLAQKASPLSHPIAILECPPRSFDVSQFYGDPTRAHTLLGWKTTIPIQEGIPRLIQQFRRMLNKGFSP